MNDINDATYLKVSGHEQKPLGKYFAMSSLAPNIQERKLAQIGEGNELSIN